MKELTGESIWFANYGIACEEIFNHIKNQHNASYAYQFVAEVITAERIYALQKFCSETKELKVQYWIEYEVDDEQFGKVIKGIICGRQRDETIVPKEFDFIMDRNNIKHYWYLWYPGSHSIMLKRVTDEVKTAQLM